MATTEENWREVGELLSGLALKVKLHVEEAQSSSGDDLRQSVEKLGQALDDTFRAMRDMTTDEALREDVRQVGQRLGDAFKTTFNQMGAQVSQSFRREEGPEPE
jgi:hypothetical protein